MGISIKTPEAVERCASPVGWPPKSSDIEPFVVAGVSTEELDRLCHHYMVDVQGGIPAPSTMPRDQQPHPNRSAPR